MDLSYERPEHERYIRELKKDGLYSEFEQAAKDCKQNLVDIDAMFRINYPTHALFTKFHPVVDQDPTDKCYYVDIGVFLSGGYDERFSITDFLVLLLECIQTKYKVSATGVYFNHTMNAFMFTVSAICDLNGPDMYSTNNPRMLIR